MSPVNILHWLSLRSDMIFWSNFRKNHCRRIKTRERVKSIKSEFTLSWANFEYIKKFFLMNSLFQSNIEVLLFLNTSEVSNPVKENNQKLENFFIIIQNNLSEYLLSIARLSLKTNTGILSRKKYIYLLETYGYFIKSIVFRREKILWITFTCQKIEIFQNMFKKLVKRFQFFRSFSRTFNIMISNITYILSNTCFYFFFSSNHGDIFSKKINTYSKEISKIIFCVSLFLFMKRHQNLYPYIPGGSDFFSPIEHLLIYESKIESQKIAENFYTQGTSNLVCRSKFLKKLYTETYRCNLFYLIHKSSFFKETLYGMANRVINESKFKVSVFSCDKPTIFFSSPKNELILTSSFNKFHKEMVKFTSFYQRLKLISLAVSSENHFCHKLNELDYATIKMETFHFIELIGSKIFQAIFYLNLEQEIMIQRSNKFFASNFTDNEKIFLQLSSLVVNSAIEKNSIISGSIIDAMLLIEKIIDFKDSFEESPEVISVLNIFDLEFFWKTMNNFPLIRIDIVRDENRLIIKSMIFKMHHLLFGIRESTNFNMNFLETTLQIFQTRAEMFFLPKKINGFLKDFFTFQTNFCKFVYTNDLIDTEEEEKQQFLPMNLIRSLRCFSKYYFLNANRERQLKWKIESIKFLLKTSGINFKKYQKLYIICNLAEMSILIILNYSLKIYFPKFYPNGRELSFYNANSIIRLLGNGILKAYKNKGTVIIKPWGSFRPNCSISKLLAPETYTFEILGEVEQQEYNDDHIYSTEATISKFLKEKQEVNRNEVIFFSRNNLRKYFLPDSRGVNLQVQTLLEKELCYYNPTYGKLNYFP